MWENINLGMDWLRPNGEEIDCEHQMVRIRMPSGGALVVHGKSAQSGSLLYSTARAKIYLQQGFS